MRVRSLSLIVPVAFAVGALTSRWLVREARADAVPFAATVYVPSDGIAFRSFDGHVIARLSYDAHGGFFEVYNEREQVASRVRGEPTGPTSAPAHSLPVAEPQPPPAPPPATHDCAPPYTIDPAGIRHYRPECL